MPEERRVVTVLFADVTGSTAMGESSDPEDVRLVLGRYYAIARAVVAEHGGTLEKFIGDAVMAVFGIPQAHGDDAERALAAALELRERVAKDPTTSALALRIGVNTGEVVAARDTDAGDFLVTGDAVNIAARLQQHAEPNSIMAGERTCRAVSGFRFGDRQTIAVKGKREPIGGSMLIARSSERRAPKAPFLGREHDLAQLQLVAQRAFSERRPQLVTITAPAGTGKSRLVDEFAAHLPAQNVTIATAQCLPYGGAVTFLPLRGLIRGLLRISTDDDIHAALVRALTTGGFETKDAERLSALVGATLGDAGDTERRDRDEIFTAWRVLVETLAAHGPLLVVFEDIHWASDTLLDLVEHITGSRGSCPLVMVALARPELLDRRPRWGGGRRNFTALSLEPLSAEETLRLVTVLTEGVPGPIAAKIVERAGGNPFFAGELVRAFEERRRAGVNDDEIELPDTVHATVLARIDGLPQAERAALEYAAVAGRTARVDTLKALLPVRTPEDLRESLDALLDRDLLVSAGPGAYTFRHIVIREVAYATLPRAERVRAHLHLAEHFEERAAAGQSEVAELIAYHYRQAIALSPGGRVPEGLAIEKVVHALEVAARAGWNAGAFAEAQQQIREAIRLAPTADHLRLFELLGDVMQFGDDAIDGYKQAYDQWRATPGGDPRVGARLMIKHLVVHGRWAGSVSRPLEPTEFSDLIREAEPLVDRADDPAMEARLALATAFKRTSEDLTDRDALEKLTVRVKSAQRLFSERGEAELESEALDALAAIYRVSGDIEAALECDRRRVAMSDRLGILERADAWSVAVWDLCYLGQFDDALRTAADAQRSLRPGEPRSMMCHVAAWAAYSAMLCGRWDEALVAVDLLVSLREEFGQVIGRFTTPGWLAGLRIASARLDTTRLARYRSVFTSIADIDSLPPGSPGRLLFRTVLDSDARTAHAYLAADGSTRDRKAEIISRLLFDHRDRIAEDELRALERQALNDPPLLKLRIALARAVNSGPSALPEAIAGLDAGGLMADAARAAALMALATHREDDRAAAERRLTALGDRAYLQILSEEW